MAEWPLSPCPGKQQHVFLVPVTPDHHPSILQNASDTALCRIPAPPLSPVSFLLWHDRVQLTFQPSWADVCLTCHSVQGKSMLSVMQGLAFPTGCWGKGGGREERGGRGTFWLQSSDLWLFPPHGLSAVSYLRHYTLSGARMDQLEVALLYAQHQHGFHGNSSEGGC